MADQTSEPDQSPRWATARVALTISGERVEAELTVPAGPARLPMLLPVFRSVAHAIIDTAVKNVTAGGQAISCKAGCGACCRQLVPIAEPEAYQIRDLIEDLPEPRRTAVRARFAAARERLQASGLLEKLLHPEQFSNDELRPMGLDYFHLGIPCPFLVDESCSIHPDRPISCREYLVTSPAENCARPSAETIRCVKLPGKASSALMRINEDPAKRFVGWVPLIIAPEWAEAHPQEPPDRPGPEWLKQFFAKLVRAQAPESAPPPAAGEN